MFKRIKSVLFVICAFMVFTAQANRPDDKGQHAPGARTAPQARTAPAARNQPAQRAAPVSRTQPENRAPAPRQTAFRQQSVKTFISQPVYQPRTAPRVYAVPVSPRSGSLPAQGYVENNDRFLNRQHQNHWQPLYNYYNGQYNFYPYVNVNSTVQLSANCVAVLYNGQTFYYDRGSFYVQDPQGYLAIPPPIGIIVNALPSWARQIGSINGQIYYRCKGAFYVQVDQGYEVVGPVQGLPEGS